MFSKIFKLSLLCGVLSLLGCGLKLGEKAKQQQLAQVAGASCLKESINNLKLFIAGDATDDQVSEATDCLGKVVITFKENVRGKTKNVYTPEEITDFVFNKLLKSDINISSDCLAEIMELKVALVGGTSDLIKAEELDALSSFIERLKPELVRINPYMKIITAKWDYQSLEPADKDAQFLKAKMAFRVTFDHLGQMLASGGREYPVLHFEKLFYEIIKMQGNNPDLLAKLEKSGPLILSAKVNLIGGNDKIVGQQWVSLTSLLSEGMFAWLRLRYYIAEPRTPEQFESRLNVYAAIAQDVFELAPELLAAQGPKAELKNSQITEMLGYAKAIYPDLNIDPELVTQAGKIKLILIGKFGNNESTWTQDDFTSFSYKLPDIINFIRVTVKNFKYYKIDATAYRNNLIKYEDFTKAETEINQAVGVFSTKILYSYDLDDFKKLVVAAQPLLKDMLTYPDNLDALFQLLYSAKVTLTGDPGPTLTVKNIQGLLTVGLRLYGNVVEFSNFILPFSTEDKEFTQSVTPWFPKVKDTITLELNNKNSHMITTDELTDLLVTAQNAEVLHTQIQKQSIQTLLNGLWSNLLNTPEDRLNEKTSLPGFNLKALDNISYEIMFWLDNQQSLLKIFEDTPVLSKADLLKKLQARLGESKSPLTQASLGELNRVVSANGNMNFDQKGFLKILTPDSGQYTIRDLTISNYGKTFARIFIRAFANDMQRITDYTGLSVDEAQFGFDQFKNVIFDMNILSPNSSKTFIPSRFLEANLFLSVSNGDDYAGFEELHHLFLHIISGQSRAKSMSDLAVQKCAKQPNSGSGPLTLLDQDCLLDLYYNISDPFLDLPGFISLRSGQDAITQEKYTPEQNKDYYLNLLEAAGHVINDKKTVAQGDACLFPHVVQYIEMIYARHDLNGDGVLDKDEALKAFPIFEKLLTKLTEPKRFFIKIPDLPGFFIYLLKNGSIPTDPAQMKLFLKFIKDYKCNDPAVPCQNGWDIHSTRFDLGRIFDFIAKATKPPPPPAPAPVDPVQPTPPAQPVTPPAPPTPDQPTPAPVPTPPNP
ncbi:MAG: hypothetical protein ACXVAX_04830 [Pseudobdellovibrio sp.]